MQPAYLLALDTSSRRGVAAVGLVEGDGLAVKPLAVRSYDGTTDHAERLLFEAEQALAEASVSLAQLSGLVVGVGPGSFTGVRVAVATAKGLALARSLPIAGVTAFESMIEGVDPGPGVLRVPILDAKRGELFLCAYDESAKLVLEPSHLGIDRARLAILSLPASAILLGEGCDLLGPIPPHASFSAFRSDRTDLPHGASLLAVGARRIARGELLDARSFEPLYLRPPDVALPAGAQPG